LVVYVVSEFEQESDSLVW